MKPRLGLFRGREFIMKDLYTFDSNMENAERTYESVREAYENIFRRIGIEYAIGRYSLLRKLQIAANSLSKIGVLGILAVGDTGIMGGTLSHEYHYLSNIGEDTVLSCRSCGFHINSTMYEAKSCAKCQNTLLEHKAVEVRITEMKILNLQIRI